MNLKHIILSLSLAGCSALGLLSPTTSPVVNRPVQYLPGSSFDPTITNGLSNDARSTYYHLDEGIQWIPTNVLLSLKRSDPSSITKVMDETLLARPERFGLLPNYTYPNSPLPIGITASTDPDYVSMAGIACPACHTSMISNDRGQFFLVDGASSRFSIEAFLGEMIKSMVATLANPVEFEAFYQRYAARANIVGQEPLSGSALSAAPMVSTSFTSSDTTKLEAAAKTAPTSTGRSTTLQYDVYPTHAQLSTRTGMYFYLVRRFLWFFGQTKYGSSTVPNMSANGFGRSDPWSPSKKMLLDKYLHQDISAVKTATLVHTPFVWDFDRQKYIFIQGQTNSLLERNLIQGIALLSDYNSSTMETTVSIKKLDLIVAYGKNIHAPSWPENILGTINREKAAQGKDIFRNLCLSCHDPKVNDTATGSAEYNYLDVGTDGTYYTVQLEKLYGKELFGDIITPFMTQAKKVAAQTDGINTIDLDKYQTNRLPVVWKAPTGNRFEAKPLAGVWATPPYLHNGSVRSIWELLFPANSRSKSFVIGGYVYDSQHLGYLDDPTLPLVDTFTVETDCASCLGNGNGGHEFGIELTEADKMLLIEFLKSYDTSTTF